MSDIGPRQLGDFAQLPQIGDQFQVLTVVVYHVIASQASFEAECDRWQEWNHTTVTPDQVHDWLVWKTPLPDKPLLLTFDDGGLSQYQYAYPVLRDRGMTGTFYVTTDWLDDTISSDAFLEADHFAWSNAKTMFDNGMRIQAHGKAHSTLDSLGYDAAVTDFQAAKTRIESQVAGETVEHLSYPSGTWDDSVLSGLDAAGVKTARVVRTNQDGTGRYAFTTPFTDPLAIPCSGANPNDLQAFNFHHQLERDPQLCPDYGFEAGGKGWTLTTGASIDATTAYEGSQSLKCVGDTTTVQAETVNRIPVGYFSRIRFTVRIKCDNVPATGARVQFGLYKSDYTTFYATSGVDIRTGGTHDWTEFEVVLTGDASFYFVKPQLKLVGDSTGGTAWFDVLDIRRDTLPPPFPPIA